MANKKIQHTGIMNKMRDKMPLIIIILIIAFLATIVFEWGMNYLGLGGKSDAFGKINSQEISYKDFERVVQQQIEQTKQSDKTSELDEGTVKLIRDNVWNSFVSQTITQQAVEEYGITVSDKEIQDWVYNKPETLPEQIKKNFMDSTGVFNISFYQQALGMKTKEATQFWNQVENYLRETLLSEKLQAVLSEGAVISEADVLEKYTDDNIYANFNYVLLDLNTITDSAQFAVNDQDLKKYYDEHKNEFKQEESVKLKYVEFKDQATAEDSAYVLKQMESLRKEMKTATEEDSSLIKLLDDNSSLKWDPEYQNPSDFEVMFKTFLDTAKPGDVSDIMIEQAGYKMLKFLDSKEIPDMYVNAEHILVNITNGDTLGAKKKAEEIYNRVKGGEDFSKLALELSDDPSAKQNKGDLGWFKKGAMVKEFEEAVFSANEGDFVGPIKSSFGFHVIHVKGKVKKGYKVAQLQKLITPSSRSKQLIKKKAEDFYADLEKGKSMDTLAKENDLTVVTSENLTKDSPIPVIGVNKKITNFVFDNKVNSVTEPVKYTTGYMIFEILEKTPQGYQNFDSIKVTILKPKVINEKKYAILSGIANDLEGKIVNGDLNSLKEFAPQYSYETADSFKVSKPNNLIGQDYALSSEIFKMKPGEISKPIKGQKGYFIIKLNSVTEFNEQDYLLKAPDIRKNLLTSKKQQMVSEWLTGMQDKADIVDNRDKYF